MDPSATGTFRVNGDITIPRQRSLEIVISKDIRIEDWYTVDLYGGVGQN